MSALLVLKLSYHTCPNFGEQFFAKGFTPVESIHQAEQLILLGYSISEPKQETGTVSAPVYGQTGVASSTTYGTYNPSSGSYYGTTYNTPTYGVTGYDTRTYTRIIYTRSLYLSAVEVRHGKEAGLGDELWKVIAVSSGSSGDLRAVFPALVTSIKNYIGVSSGNQVGIRIDVDNPTVISK
jgi:hypothetical protein